MSKQFFTIKINWDLGEAEAFPTEEQHQKKSLMRALT